MKLQTNLLLAAFASVALAAAVPDVDAVAKCGSLEVMKYDPQSLPDGVAPSDVRMYADHPMGRERSDTSDAPVDAYIDTSALEYSNPLELQPRACSTHAPYGFSDGYCWKVCNSKFGWCWTAFGRGFGSWRTCRSHKDCGTNNVTHTCARGCKDPGLCGCSC